MKTPLTEYEKGQNDDRHVLQQYPHRQIDSGNSIFLSNQVMDRGDARECHQNIEVPEIGNFQPRKWVENPQIQPWPRDSNESLARCEISNKPYYVSKIRKRKKELICERIYPD